MKQLLVAVLVLLGYVATLRPNHVQYKQDDNRTPKLHAADPVTSLPPPDGALHVYTLPVGYGDAHVVQCPKGDLNIFDMGSTDRYFGKFWDADRVRSWLGAGSKLVRNVFISNNNLDYHNYLRLVFNNTMDVLDLQNLYVSCTEKEVENGTAAWVAEVVKTQLSHNKTMVLTNTFHDGHACVGAPCGDNLTLCAGETDIHVEVLAANQGSCNTTAGHHGRDSLLLRIHHGSVSILMGGGLSNEGPNNSQDLPLDLIMAGMGAGLKSHVYKMGHHGTNLANPACWLELIQPEAVFVSSNPFNFTIQQPHCSAIWKTQHWLRNATPPWYLCWLDGYQDGVEEFDSVYTTTCGNDPKVVFLLDLRTNGTSWTLKPYSSK